MFVENLKKKCCKCQELKDVSCFSKSSFTKDGRCRICRCCRKYYYEQNKERAKLRKKEYYEKNKEKILAQNMKWKKENKQHYAMQQKKYRESNKEKIKEKTLNWIENNKDKIAETRRIYEKTRKNRDVNYKLTKNLRNRLCCALKNDQKTGSAVKDLGCSVNSLKLWLESQFYLHPKTGEEMSWENYGLHGWHIDHVVPLVSFDLTDYGQLKKACHWSNLAPLWGVDNFSKGSKI